MTAPPHSAPFLLSQTRAMVDRTFIGDIHRARTGAAIVAGIPTDLSVDHDPINVT